jgi:branched-chain amino acid transport system ATP-binding protein
MCEYAMEVLKLAGIDKQARELAGNLPQGQQRLLEMARALATDPELLLLDEPAAGLNFQEEDALKEALTTIIKSGVSILLVEHDMRMVMDISDWVNVLDLGRKIAEGTPSQIGKDPTVIKAYLGREIEHA